MRYNQPIYLNSPTVVLGDGAQTPAEAAAAGRLNPLVAERCGYRQVAITDSAPVDLAHRAATATLVASGIEPLKVSRLFHAWNYHQGHEVWSPAHYVASKAGAQNAIPLGIQQMCNGGTFAVEMAARELIADPELPLALITTADRFADPGFDRWGDLGLACGDGATAVLVGPAPCGPSARLLVSVSAAAPHLEEAHRGNLEFSPTPTSGSRPIRVSETRRQFAERQPDAEFQWMIPDLIVKALAEAGIKPGGAAAVTLPRLAPAILEKVRPSIEAAAEAPLVVLGQDTGHLGAGDTVANLVDITDSGGVGAGDIVVSVSAGGGVTWTVLILRIGT